ncbi:MAG TPA: SDR family NAD(P)-dependent oxidoreductase [Chloroflexota bacterium]|nr:SDR family NAD(P)-dependent oxidoreductase [Chloroflexota bacterium]
MRVAIVGCGQIAGSHLAALRKVDGAEVVAVCDRDAQRARHTAELAQARAYTDLDALLRAERPDAVHIVTPPASHAPLAIRAIEAGCHVLVEKPMALSTADADRMIAAARAHGVKLCTNHNYRFKPSIRRATELVARGEIGQVLFVNSYYGLSDEGADFDGGGGGHWAQRLPGGVFTNFLPHLLYLQLSFLPGVDSVAGVALGRGREPDAPPTELTVLLQGPQAAGSMTFSTLAKPYAKFVEIYGTTGLIHADLVREVCVVHRHRRIPRLLSKALFSLEASTQLATGIAANTAGVATGRMRNMPELPIIFRHFYDSIRTDGAPPAPGEEGRAVVALMEQIWARLPAPPSPAAAPSVVSAPLPRTAVERRVVEGGGLPGKILVTGASGYLGRHLVAALGRCGADVVALVRDGSRAPRELERHARVVEGDLSAPASLESAIRGCSLVFHCAAVTRNNAPWSEHYETNVRGSKALFERALAAGVRRIVHVSSIIVYGLDQRRGGAVVDETAPYAEPRDSSAFYLRSKLESDRLALDMHRKDGLPVTVIRPGIIFGPGGGRAIGRGLLQLGRLRLTIGSGRNVLPFTYIDNLVDALLLAATSSAAIGQAYNIVDQSGPTAPSVRDCALLASELEGEPISLVPVPAAALTGAALLLELRQRRAGSDVPPRLSRFVVRSAVCDLRYSSARARRDLGWEPAVSVREGLSRTVGAAPEPPPTSAKTPGSIVEPVSTVVASPSRPAPPAAPQMVEAL